MTASARFRRLGRWSVRTRITAVITIVSAFGMLSVGLVVYFVERARILEQVDERLLANLESARYIVGEPGRTWDSTRAALEAVVMRMSPDDNTGALGIIDGAPALVPGLDLDVDLQRPVEFAAHAARVGAVEPVIGTYAEHGVTWRYLAVPLTVPGSADADTVVFALAYDLDAELAEIDVPTRIYLVAAGIAIIIIAAAAGLVSARLLTPLRMMRETATRITAQSLSERLPVRGRDDVSELAATMNDMLDRLHDALDSQRQLLSDVGHELKTPITIVRGYLEVMDATDPADIRETRALAVDELERMAELVQDLAGAASLHGPSPITRQSVDAGDLVAQIVHKAQRIEGAQVIQGETADVAADLDPNRITQAMLQLAQNGVTHGGGRLVIGSRLRGTQLELWVRDFGPGVPDEAKTVVFERFHRGATGGRAAHLGAAGGDGSAGAADGRGGTDSASPPGRGTRGSGLGLNIVAMIAHAHGGTAEVRDADQVGAEFVICVPRSTDAAGHSTTSPDPPREEMPTDGLDPDRR